MGREQTSRASAARSQGHHPASSRQDGPLAALDLGTNNCRLLVVEPDGEGFRVKDAFSRAVRLGEGVLASNLLSPAAQDRAIKALRICAGKIRQHRVSEARLIATEACRRAGNGRAFARRVQRETGLTLDIISAEDEARLAVAGCAPLVDPQAEQLLVFDIGGGSTELIWVDMSHTPSARRQALIRALAPMGEEDPTARAAAAHVSDWISLPLGVSTLHDRFAEIEGDAVRFEQMAAFVVEKLSPFDPFARRDPEGMMDRLQIIGVSGTATTFGALHLGLTSYDRSRVDGLWLGAPDAAKISARLIGMDGGSRARHPGIGSSRSELIISGAAILMTILRLWPTPRLRIADRGLREGLLYGLLHKRRGGEA
ncbi:MAG: Ppx/GppA phosphatase family protein [Pseudomonadota bacterium]